MRAIILKDIQQELEEVEFEKPKPAADEVLVKLHAAAFNHRDLWIQKGQYAGLKFPIILGSDGCGNIEAVGSSISNHLIGKDVIINPSIGWGKNEKAQSKTYKILGLPDNGTFAEYVTVPAINVHEKPEHLSYEEAAALPLGGLTAFRALFSRANCKAGNNVLITGAGGGVALFAIQFALAAGAKVYVTSGSQEKIAKAIEIGVKGGENYKYDDWSKNLKIATSGFDIIVDSAAGENFGKLIDLANSGATIVFYGGTTGNINNLNPQKIFWKQLNILGSTMGSDSDFRNMLQFVSKHKLKPIIDKVFSFERAQQGLERMAQKEQFGKIVLKIA